MENRLLIGPLVEKRFMTGKYWGIRMLKCTIWITLKGGPILIDRPDDGFPFMLRCDWQSSTQIVIRIRRYFDTK